MSLPVKHQQLIEQGYKCYQGEGINVYFNSQRCQHSGNCVRGNPQVFNLQHRPWINANGAGVQEVIKLVNNCPSGALQYIEK